MTYTVGLDVGTQGTKGLLLQADTGKVVSRAHSNYDLLPGLPNGAAEQHPHTWRDAAAEVLLQLLQESRIAPEAIVAVGVSGQQHGSVFLDGRQQVVRPAKLWCDTSTADEAAQLSEAFGRNVPTGFTASKLLWLARHEPDHWARTSQVLLPHDYINLLLTGESAMEAGDASGTGLFDVRQRKFDDASLSAFDALLANSTDAGLASRLPRLQAVESPQSALGSVTASAAEQFGLAPGTLVSRGGGDNMMSAIGSGATQPGVTTLSLGTSGTVFAYSDSPVVDPEGLIAPFCGSAGGWLPLLCVMNLTGVTEEVRAGFKQDHETLTACAREVEPGCDGLLWIPYLNGERVPDLPNATGTLLGMRPGNLRAGTMYRAALEGTSMNLAWGVERLRALGVPTTELRLVGGAANNSLWREIIANCLNASVTQLAEAESAALGAALQALWSWHHETGTPVALEELSASCVQTLGEITPADQELSARYATLATRFRQEALRV